MKIFSRKIYSAINGMWKIQQLINTLKVVANSKKLLALNKTLLKLFALKRFITQHRHTLKQNANSATAVIVTNIEKLTSVMSLTKCLHLLQLDFSWWHLVKHKIRCSDSLRFLFCAASGAIDETGSGENQILFEGKNTEGTGVISF